MGSEFGSDAEDSGQNFTGCIHNKKCLVAKKLASLKLTASLHLKMDGWNLSFLLGLPIFRGELLVSRRVGGLFKQH